MERAGEMSVCLHVAVEPTTVHISGETRLEASLFKETVGNITWISY